jgi:transcriptional regulator with XRE-family HTH domain
MPPTRTRPRGAARRVPPFQGRPPAACRPARHRRCRCRTSCMTYGSDARSGASPGLRREEVAVLAGVSVEYYVRLERGDLRGASDSVLDALARALQLNDAERLHLYDLPRGGMRERGSPAEAIRPSLQRLLDAIDAPALVRNRRLDYLAANAPGRALAVRDVRVRAAQPGAGTCSSIRAQGASISIPTGTRWPAISRPCCAWSSAAAPRIDNWRRSSKSCSRPAPTSVPVGER